MLARLALFAAAVLPAAAPLAQERGLRLFQTIASQRTRMVDEQGVEVHSWPGFGGLVAHVGEDGTLWRGMQTGTTLIGGATGRIQRLSYDGTVLWDYLIDGPFSRAHHDIEPMPNGNVLVIAWDSYVAADAIARGRNPATLAADFWPDAILEIQPTGPTTGVVVWEWHMIDHLVQDFDPTKAGYGVVRDHPELLDINYPPVALTNGDWNHFNGLDYDPVNDWIIVSSREQDEIYLIDHSTTTAEAAGHTGGLRGKGGDILWRWGNAEAYRAGSAAQHQLRGQHDPRFIPAGRPGAGRITVFNNEYVTSPSTQSAVFELGIPLDANGEIVLDPVTGRFGPTSPSWVFTEPGFLSLFVSSAERLPNGHTLICSGLQRRLFEVTPSGQTVWSYTDPNPGIVFQSSFVERSLWADADTLSVSGGQVGFDHLVGSNHAGEVFLLLGSVSGRTPGTVIGGVTLPLRVDYLTSAMATQFNTGPFVHTIGTLAPNGESSSAIVVPSGFIPPALTGLQMDFAHLVFDASLQPVRASNATTVTIVP